MKILNESKTVLFEMNVDFDENDVVEKEIKNHKSKMEAILHHPNSFYLKNSFIFDKAKEIGFSRYECNHPLKKMEGFNNLCAVVEIVKY